MKTFVTSDTHFGHKNMTGPEVSEWKSGYRTFSSIEEMDGTLLENINSMVGKNDRLIHHGDFAYKSRGGIIDYINQINCDNVILVLGNHDNIIKKKREFFKQYFSAIEFGYEFNYDNKKVICSHYAMRVWYGHQKGYLHTYGHSHNNLPSLGRSMDVGVDVAYSLFGEYRPFNIDEVYELIKDNNIQKLDHHIKEK